MKPARPQGAPAQAHRRPLWPWALALAMLATPAAVLWRLQPQPAARDRLLLAPMFNILEPCIQPGRAVPQNPTASVADWCGPGSASAAPVVDATLSALGPRLPANPHLELGYTLQIPLLRLLRREGDDWAVDRASLGKLVRTLQDVDRPAVVYLFSTHFGVYAPIERELAADPRNLLVSQKGPLPVDSYFGDEVFPWNFTSTDNGITRRRLQVIDAFLEEVCRLPQADRDKVRGITLLGELHQMFPKLQSGMGYGSPYVITDYSEVSRQGFREHLKNRFRTIERLNKAMVTDYRSFDAVDPPSKDIRREPLRRYTEHIDAFAHGSFPVTGWVHVPRLAAGRHAWVRVYLDGYYLGRAPVRGGRQDVASARPEFGTADVGWQFDVDFRGVEVGMHQVDVMLEDPAGGLPFHLDRRHVAVLDRRQGAPRALPSQPLPAHRQAPAAAAAGASWFLDGPADQSSYFHNPLVPLWHEFRGLQVTRYLAFLDQHVRQSCLRDTPVYTHQILPFINPGWDKHRFASEDSLRPLGQTRTGISLYGEATYGDSFDEWFKKSKLSSYGVTEFHPLRAMQPTEVQSMFERHRRRGADFLSFFLEPKGLAPGNGVGLNQFSFNPDVPNFYSDILFRSTKSAINHPGDR